MRDVVVTRVQARPPRRSRSLEERIYVRFPSAFRLLSRVSGRLRPHSRLRRTLFRRSFISGWAAYIRGDLKLMLVRYAPDVEFNPGQQTIGLGGKFYGHEGVIRGLRDLAEGWSSWNIEPAYLVDLGDQVITLGFLRARARASGLELEGEFAQQLTVRDGLIEREQSWSTWEEALRAAGLDQDQIALPPIEQTGGSTA
jgi:ketosteroid isomerase-like protein